MAFKTGLRFRDFQSLRVSTEFSAPHKIIDRLYQNRVYLDRVYRLQSSLASSNVYHAYRPIGLHAAVFDPVTKVQHL